MQILHPFTGSIQRYFDEIADPNRYRPDHCPQCEVKRPLTGHGFYRRTLVDATFDGVIRVRRYLCRSCKRTVSLLPDFVLPWLRFSISVIALFLAARLLNGLTLATAARAAAQTVMPYQRGHEFLRCQAQARGRKGGASDADWEIGSRSLAVSGRGPSPGIRRVNPYMLGPARAVLAWEVC